MHVGVIKSSSWLLAGVLMGCAADADADRPEQRASRALQAPLHSAEVIAPAVLRGLPLSAGEGGRTVVTPCTTCHDGRAVRPLPSSAQGIGGPHAGLEVKHGDLLCASCHDGERRERLRLADGRSIALLDALQLCAQCHGPQKRDFDHGAHGGMRGYWDLRAGPRERNHCVACHDPHAPQFGRFAPVPGPRDRFTSHQPGPESRHD